MSIQAEWQASMRCGKRDIRLWISVNFAGVKNSKSIPTKSLIDRCENVINIEVVCRNTMKRDSSLNVYRQRNISFEEHGAGPRHSKTGHVDDFRNRRNWNLKLLTYSLLKTPNQVYLPIFSLFGEIVWQRLFNMWHLHYFISANAG